MLYLFAGIPGMGATSGQYLHAGGLQYCIEEVEQLGDLEHDPNIQVRKEGVFIENTDELLYDVNYNLSELLRRDGITWDWFPKEHSFGNGVTIFKFEADYDRRTVVNGTELTMNEYLETLDGPVRMGDLLMERKHIRSESWEGYEARWLLDENGKTMCPQYNHIVYVTALLFTHKLPQFAYKRIKDIVEQAAIPESLDLYSYDGEHFSTLRRYDGKSFVDSMGNR